jgi:hypothetical protein
MDEEYLIGKKKWDGIAFLFIGLLCLAMAYFVPYFLFFAGYLIGRAHEKHLIYRESKRSLLKKFSSND